MRILISNPDNIGDLILRQPLFAALTENRHELMLVVRRSVAPIASAIAPGARTLHLDDDPYSPLFNIDSPTLQGMIGSALEFSPDVVCVPAYQRTQFDEYLATSLPEARSVGFAGSFYRGLIDYGLDLKSAMSFDQAVAVSEDSSELAKNERLCSALLGRNVTLPPPRIEPAPEQIGLATTRLARFGMEPGTFWLACVGDNEFTAVKNWRHEQWAQFLSACAGRFGDRFVFVGTPDEKAATDDIFQMMGDAADSSVNLCGSGDNLDLLVGLVSLANGYVGRDTGPMHLASALDKPVISVFGGGHWPRFVPAARRGVVWTVRVPCSGCDWACHLSESYCVKRVPVEPFIQEVEAFRSNPERGFSVRALDPDDVLRARLVREAAENARESLRRNAAREREYQATLAVREDELRRKSLELDQLARAAAEREAEQEALKRELAAAAAGHESARRQGAKAAAQHAMERQDWASAALRHEAEEQELLYLVGDLKDELRKTQQERADSLALAADREVEKQDLIQLVDAMKQEIRLTAQELDALRQAPTSLVEGGVFGPLRRAARRVIAARGRRLNEVWALAGESMTLVRRRIGPRRGPSVAVSQN
jgi:ADP-heptose:LPS heptosyltransferase